MLRMVDGWREFMLFILLKDFKFYRNMWGRLIILWFEEKFVDFLFLVNIFLKWYCFDRWWNILVSVEKFLI